MKNINIISAIISLFFTMSCAKDIVDLTGDISGVVKDAESGSLVSNCQVSISTEGASVTTGNDGSFSFTDLTPGSYTLSFSKFGYDNETKTVTVTAGQTTKADIILKSKEAFYLSDTFYDYGDLATTKTFYCYNNSDMSCSYTISNIPDWLTVNKKSGTIDAGSNDSFTATVNRDLVEIGEKGQNITVSFTGKTSGVKSIQIKMKKVLRSSPKVSIAKSANNITKNSFDIDGNIDATGGLQIISYGHCWSTSPNPTVSGSKTDLGTTQEIGIFKSTVSDLALNTTYYVRAYARNAEGISYSDVITVTTQDAASNKWDGNIAKSFAGGSGTNADPYLIETGGQLLLMKDYKSKCFKLVNNINLDNHNWLPFDFSGTLDGQDNTISNLKISRTTDNQGLFSTLYGEVKNLTVSGVNIQAGANGYIGAITGTLNGKILNCTININSGSKILGNNYVGGIVGCITGYSTVSGCKVISSVNDNVIIGSEHVGGIVGIIGDKSASLPDYSKKVYVEECHVNAMVYGTSFVGGICGAGFWSYWNEITACSYTGKIGGENAIGGIFGGEDYNGSYRDIVSLTISECKVNATFNVEKDSAGGIYGSTPVDIRIFGCYSTGTMYCSNSQAKSLGGIGGYMYRYAVEANLCYSAMESQHSGYNELGAGAESDCASVQSCDNITTYLKELYSEYASCYNFNNTWTWTGTVNGSTVSVSCPKLAWEK